VRAQALFNYAALALALGSLAHVIGFFMGPDAIAFMGAPQEFVQGYRNGDWVWTAFVTFSIAGLLACLAPFSGYLPLSLPYEGCSLFYSFLPSWPGEMAEMQSYFGFMLGLRFSC